MPSAFALKRSGASATAAESTAGPTSPRLSSPRRSMLGSLVSRGKRASRADSGSEDAAAPEPELVARLIPLRGTNEQEEEHKHSLDSLNRYVNLHDPESVPLDSPTMESAPPTPPRRSFPKTSPKAPTPDVPPPTPGEDGCSPGEVFTGEVVPDELENAPAEDTMEDALVEQEVEFVKEAIKETRKRYDGRNDLAGELLGGGPSGGEPTKPGPSPPPPLPPPPSPPPDDHASSSTCASSVASASTLSSMHADAPPRCPSSAG